MKLPNHMLTIEEYKDLKSLLSKKATSLMKHEKKPGTQTGFPISNHLLFPLCGKKYYCISTNTFRSIITHDVLKSAATQYPENFGTGNAYDVIKAVLLTTKTELNGLYENYKNRHKAFCEFLSGAHCYVVEQKSNGNFNDKILRIDLFRKIDISKKNKNKYDFTGGLFHAFKHFSIADINLSIGRDRAELYHPIRIIDFTLKAFFCTDLEPSKKNNYITDVKFDRKYDLKFVFYHEEKTGVFFINTIRKGRRM